MIISLKNKRALVTGGGTGLGQSIVKALADSGASVAFTSRKKNSLKETYKLLGNKNKHLPCQIDLFKKGNEHHSLLASDLHIYLNPLTKLPSRLIL